LLEYTPFFENLSFFHFFVVQSLALSLRVSSLVQASDACKGSDDLGSFAQDRCSAASTLGCYLLLMIAVSAGCCTG
jgi:hypothetical protein